MAKSKEQKRQEAMLRARAVLPMHRDTWMRSQPGGDLYENALKYGKENADRVQRQAEMTFDRACRHAGTDRHGNPL